MPKPETTRALVHSSRIAAGLLDALAEDGDVARRSRALRALGSQAAMVHGRPGWIDRDKLAEMIRSVGDDPRLARRVGHSVMRPHVVGLALSYGGLATTEKAYRRADHLLVRESANARYRPQSIEGRQGSVIFEPPPHGDAARLPDEAGKMMCAMRQGMLEAIPLLYGLVPARVCETQCAYEGADHCSYDVQWTRSPRVGLALGAGLGLSAGLALLATAWFSGWPLLSVGWATPVLTVLCAAAGRSVDLARQLEAVAGARRGHLALLDQLDTELAERMDSLAKLGGASESSAHPSAHPRAHEDAAPTGLVPVGRTDRGLAGLEPGAGEAERTHVSLRAIVDDTVTALRKESPSAVDLVLELESVPPVEGVADQLAFVVEQLLRNALQASGESQPESAPEEGDSVRVTLRRAEEGVALSVEDRGPGIDPEMLDQVFDPFDAQEEAGREGGLGLPVCGRIVESHGGELRVQSEGESGTRVVVLLPATSG